METQLLDNDPALLALGPGLGTSDEPSSQPTVVGWLAVDQSDEKHALSTGCNVVGRDDAATPKAERLEMWRKEHSSKSLQGALANM